MELKKIFVEEIGQAPWNWSTPTDATLLTVANSLRRVGQLRPIFVHEKGEQLTGTSYEVLDGNTVVLAAGRAGLTELWAVVYPEMEEVDAIERALELNLCGGELRSKNKCHAALSAALGKLAAVIGLAGAQTRVGLDAFDTESYITLYKTGFDWENYIGPRGSKNMTLEEEAAAREKSEQG